jgi:integrase
LSGLGETDPVGFAHVLPTLVPEVVHSDAWAASLRQQTRAIARGWTVEEARGKVRLKVRPEGTAGESLMLPFEWSAASAGDAYVRIRNIYALMASEGYSLKQAALVADGKAPRLTEQQDWHGAVERFQQQKLSHGTAIKPATWAAKYAPVLTDAVALLTGRKPPTTPADLIDRCIRVWEPGSRTRQERARNLAQFLRYCVTRERVPAIWQPPADLKDAIGRKPATASSQKSDAITDQQILTLLASLPDDDSGRRWADALRLLAELGLRPVELLHLSVRIDPKTGEPYWWCSYEKRAGGGVTKPRRLWPLPLQGDDGRAVQWSLMQRWQARLIVLPPLRAGNGAADAIATYLNRREGWRSLRAQLEGNGERLSCYSFRHSYSVRGHQRDIDNGSMALAMGHSIEVHCRSYPWASEAGAAAAFVRAGQRLAGHVKTASLSALVQQAPDSAGC